MPDKFKELFEEARNSGLPDDWVTRFEETFEASGLRKDNLSVKEENQRLREATSKLRNGLLKDRFEKFGITISPNILQIPDDLDPSDPEKVQSWAEEMGLLAKQDTTESSERQIHDKIADASNEGGNTAVPDANSLDPSKMSQEEFYKAAAVIEKARTR